MRRAVSKFSSNRGCEGQAWTLGGFKLNLNCAFQKTGFEPRLTTCPVNGASKFNKGGGREWRGVSWRTNFLSRGLLILWSVGPCQSRVAGGEERGGQRAKGEREKKAALFRRHDDDDGGDGDGVRVTWKRATLAPAISFARTRGSIKSSERRKYSF